MKHFGEFKIMTLRETPPTSILSTPDELVRYYRENIMTLLEYWTEQEQVHVILINTRCRCIGHTLVALGALDQVVITPREIFRPAIIAAAYSVVMIHNHPIGDPTPSDADARITREMVQAGKILRVPIADHVIVSSAGNGTGRETWTILRGWVDVITSGAPHQRATKLWPTGDDLFFGILWTQKGR